MVMALVFILITVVIISTLIMTEQCRTETLTYFDTIYQQGKRIASSSSVITVCAPPIGCGVVFFALSYDSEVSGTSALLLHYINNADNESYLFITM